MAFPVDFTVHDKEGTPTLLVEVKALTGRSENWARQMRRNLSVHGPLPPAPFFLLTLPDQFFLWSNHSRLDPTAPPSSTIDAEPLLQPYFARAGISPDQMSGGTFELVVRTWLQRIIQAPNSDALPNQSREWVYETGLFDAIREGSIEQSGIPA